MFKELIGNTPMIKIKYEYKGKEKLIYIKLEMYNFTGSIKDRVAYYMIKMAEEKGFLKENMPIVEATSGNTGISLAALGSYYKHPVHIFMPDWASKERIQLMKLYGAKVTLISKEDGGFIKCAKEAKKMAEEQSAFLANQFANSSNILAHYETTAKEILEQLGDRNIGAFVSGVGTGGTLIGIGKRIKENNKQAKIIALEPKQMPIISGGEIIGQHKIEGIGDDFIPEIYSKNNNIVENDTILVDDKDAINMSRILAKNLGLGVGISSGANFIAGVLLNEQNIGNVVTVFPDDNKKYLSTELSEEIDEERKYISNNIKLINIERVGDRD